MFWITKYKHNKLVAEYEQAIDDLKKTLNCRNDIVEILDRLTDKETSPFVSVSNSFVAGDDVMSHLDDSVPRYVEDVNGGKVIKQEATPVTILDEDGKATYGYTKESPDKGKKYQLKETIIKERK